LALWRGVRDRTIVLRRIPHPGDIEHDKLGPDRALFARLAIDRDDGAAHWCRQFDRCLVGHDVDERILLADLLPDRHMPGDDLGFGRALADIRESDDVTSHPRLIVIRGHDPRILRWPGQARP
jgi:hypothetical protein